MQWTLGGLTKKHGLMMLFGVPTIVVGWMYAVVGEDAAIACMIMAVITAVQLYWLVVAAVNRWTVRAHGQGVLARYGPLPWFFLTRSHPWRDIRGFVSVGDSIEVGGTEYTEGRLEVVGAGIDVLHPDGYTSNLIRGCSDFAKVSRVKAELEALHAAALSHS